MTPVNSTEKLGSDHHALRLRTDRLWAVLHAPAHVLSSRAWHDLLLMEVADLSAALEEHFAREEEGGYLRDFVGDSATLSRKADALLAEHRDIRDRLGALPELLEAGEKSLERVRDSLCELISVARWHENKENDLVQEAALRDLGAQD